MNVLLTSAGFESQTVQNAFLRLLGKPAHQAKALFIPTAAIFPEAIAVLPKCMDDLLKAGILPQNITVFDLHRAMPTDELSTYDAVYLTGGNPEYLMARINATGFNVSLNKFVSKGGVYVGVSAGSYVAAGNMPDSLGYLNASLSVHVEAGTAIGVFDNDAVAHISLTDANAVMIANGRYEVI